MTSIAQTTDIVTHPKWCDPTRCDVEVVDGKPTGDVYHWGADEPITDGIGLALARLDRNGEVAQASRVYVSGGLPDGPVELRELEDIGQLLVQRAAAFRRQVEEENGPAEPARLNVIRDTEQNPLRAERAKIDHTAYQHPRPLPPIRCQPWCRWQDGHPGQVFHADQCCDSEAAMVRVSCYPAVKDFDDTYVPSELAVYAMQRPGERVFVELSLNEANTLRMTDREAREIGAHLIEKSAVDSWTSDHTVVDEENGLAVRETDTGSVYLEDGEGWDYSFAPDEARALAFALLVHAAHADRVEVDR